MFLVCIDPVEMHARQNLRESSKDRRCGLWGREQYFPKMVESLGVSSAGGMLRIHCVRGIAISSHQRDIGVRSAQSEQVSALLDELHDDRRRHVE